MIAFSNACAVLVAASLCACATTTVVPVSDLRCGDPGDVVWVTAYVTSVGRCDGCPAGAVCGPCPPPHLVVVGREGAEPVPIWWSAGDDVGEGRSSKSEPKDFVLGKRYAFECRIVSCSGENPGELVYLSHR
jgi:hypothetical protein